MNEQKRCSKTFSVLKLILTKKKMLIFTVNIQKEFKFNMATVERFEFLFPSFSVDIYFLF